MVFTWWCTTIWLLFPCPLSLGLEISFLSRETSPAGVKSYIFLGGGKKKKSSGVNFSIFQGRKISLCFPGCFLPSFPLFKEQNRAEGKGKKWLNVSGKQSKGFGVGQSHHRLILRAGHQDHTEWELPGLRLLLPFFYCVSFKVRCLCSLWISSVENLSLINNCLCWIYRWAKLFSLMLQFSTFSFSGLCEHWHSKEINLSLR